jgi:hypothetical protein
MSQKWVKKVRCVLFNLVHPYYLHNVIAILKESVILSAECVRDYTYTLKEVLYRVGDQVHLDRV